MATEAHGRLSLEPFTGHAYDRRIPYMKIAMIAALNNPATGTVTNQATKMFRKRCQSTAFRERIQPTATTEPTCRGRSITVKGETPGVASQTLTSRVSVMMSVMDPESFHTSSLGRSFYIFIIYAIKLAPLCKVPMGSVEEYNHTLLQHTARLIFPTLQRMLGPSPLTFLTILKIPFVYLLILHVCGWAHTMAPRGS